LKKAVASSPGPGGVAPLAVLAPLRPAISDKENVAAGKKG
jgi:hypothetical protein